MWRILLSAVCCLSSPQHDDPGSLIPSGSQVHEAISVIIVIILVLVLVSRGYCYIIISIPRPFASLVREPVPFVPPSLAPPETFPAEGPRQSATRSTSHHQSVLSKGVCLFCIIHSAVNSVTAPKCAHTQLLPTRERNSLCTGCSVRFSPLLLLLLLGVLPVESRKYKQYPLSKLGCTTQQPNHHHQLRAHLTSPQNSDFLRTFVLATTCLIRPSPALMSHIA